MIRFTNYLRNSSIIIPICYKYNEYVFFSYIIPNILIYNMLF